MAAPWILASKLSAPVRPAAWLPRPGLLPGERLPPCTLVVAGQGGGKTLALLELAGRCAPEAILLWYALDELDADPVSFFQHLLAGMRRHVPGFASELDDVLTGPAPDPRRVWRGFFATLGAYNLPGLVLALDDLHYLAEARPEWVRALGPFLEHLPPGTHVLASARRTLPLPRAKLVAARVLAELDATALRFDATEAVAYLTLRAPNGDVPAAWRERAATLDGWPLGLALVSADADFVGAGRGKGEDALGSFIAEELVAGQPAACQAFMLRAALLEELVPAALETSFPGLEAQRWLAHLEAEQLIMRVADGRGYRFPAYLVGFLRAEAARSLGAEQLGAAHRQAAAYHRAHGRADMAIPHLLASGDRAEAAEVCRAIFPALGAQGRFEPIERWLASFPAAFVAGDGTLLLWRGHLLARRGEASQALEAYADARALFAAAGDRPGELKALVRQCTLLAHGQDAPRLGPLIMQALALLPLGEDVDRADLAMVRALQADQRGDLGLLQECNEAILALPALEPELGSAHWIARINMYTLALHRGELDGAARHAAEAIAVAERHGLAAYARVASFMAAHLDLVVGETERAAAFVRHLPPGWEDLLESHDLGCALAIIGQLHEVKEDWRLAEDALARARALFERAGHKLAVKVALERQAWLAIARGQPGRALVLCDEVEAGGDSAYDLALALARARARHLAGDVVGAGAAWTPLIAELDRQQARLLAMRARLYAAATCLKSGQADEARTAVDSALELAVALGYGFLRHQDRTLWQELEPLLATTPPAPLAGPGAASTPDAPAHRVAVDASAGTAEASKGLLEIRCFGGFEVRLAGGALEHWPRRKAKRVLAALALCRGELDSAGLAAVFEEPDGEAGVTAIRLAVMALRRVLEPDLGKGEASRYVRSTGEGYALAMAEVAYLDVRAFAEGLARADKLAATDATAAAAAYAEALEHYRGNLLEEPLFAGPFDLDRLRFQREALAAADFLQRYHLGRGDSAGAERWLRRAIAIAPCDEAAYLALMRFYQAAGETDRMRQTYWDHRKELKLQLDLAPGEEFEAAYRELLGAKPAARVAR